MLAGSVGTTSYCSCSFVTIKYNAGERNLRPGSFLHFLEMWLINFLTFNQTTGLWANPWLHHSCAFGLVRRGNKLRVSLCRVCLWKIFKQLKEVHTLFFLSSLESLECFSCCSYDLKCCVFKLLLWTMRRLDGEVRLKVEFRRLEESRLLPW